MDFCREWLGSHQAGAAWAMQTAGPADLTAAISFLCRARHYIHIPVHFRPKSAGKFEALLIIQTDEGKSVAVRLTGEALEKD